MPRATSDAVRDPLNLSGAIRTDSPSGPRSQPRVFTSDGTEVNLFARFSQGDGRDFPATVFPRTSVVASPPGSGVRMWLPPRARAFSKPAGSLQRPGVRRGDQASSQHSRSGRSGWRCPCRRCPGRSMDRFEEAGELTFGVDDAAGCDADGAGAGRIQVGNP